MSHYDAIVFDCDGVLVDSEKLAARVTQRTLSDLGWELDLGAILKKFVGCSYEFYINEIEKHLGRRLEPGWMKSYNRWLDQIFESDLKPITGIKDALESIRLPKAVASNSHHKRIEKSLDIVGLLEMFEGRINSAEDVSAGKPAPDVYLRAARMLQAEPQRCIAVEDSKFGVMAAHRAGMHVLAYGDERAFAWLARDERVQPFSDMAHLPKLVQSLVSSGDNGMVEDTFGVNDREMGIKCVAGVEPASAGFDSPVPEAEGIAKKY